MKSLESYVRMQRLIHPLHRCGETAHEVPIVAVTAAAAAGTEEAMIGVATAAAADDLLPPTVEAAMAAAEDLTVVVIVETGLLPVVIPPWTGTTRLPEQEMMDISPVAVGGMSTRLHHRGEEVPGMKIVVRREGGRLLLRVRLERYLLRMGGSVRERTTAAGAIGEVRKPLLFLLLLVFVFCILIWSCGIRICLRRNTTCFSSQYQTRYGSESRRTANLVA